MNISVHKKHREIKIRKVKYAQHNVEADVEPDDVIEKNTKLFVNMCINSNFFDCHKSRKRWYKTIWTQKRWCPREREHWTASKSIPKSSEANHYAYIPFCHPDYIKHFKHLFYKYRDYSLLCNHKNLAAFKSSIFYKYVTKEFDEIVIKFVHRQKKGDYLDLSYTPIGIFPEHLVDDMNDLENLKMEWNQFGTIPSNSFNSLTKLKILTLSCNQLTSLPNDIFLPLVSLNALHIDHNNIKYLHDDIFKSLTKLEILNISSNRIGYLHNDIFKSLTALKELHMESNKLKTISDDLLKPLTMLQILNISFNNLTTISNDIFSPLTALNEIDMCCNKITDLADTSFDSLVHLTNLDMSYNKLKILPNVIFRSLRSLQTLNLNNNILHMLPLSIINCTQLRDLTIGNNPIIIDQRIQPFIDAIQAMRIGGVVKNKNIVSVYGDSQNVHSSSIQSSLRTSINNLLRDRFNITKKVLMQKISMWKLKNMAALINILNDKNVHSDLFVSFYDVFVKIYGRIISSENCDTLITRLDEELSDGINVCFTGKLTRLVNVLSGFYDDIQINISNAERISAIILSTLNGRQMDNILYKTCFSKLTAIGMGDEEIKKWLE